MTTKRFRALSFIGRFQPFHNGHLHVVKEAAKLADTVLILVGSSNMARSPRNPFTFEERKDMILESCDSVKLSDNKGRRGVGANVIVAPISDHFNDDLWIAEVQATIRDKFDLWNTGLIGYSKDQTSYYLKMFPKMESVDVPSQHGMINSSDIRKQYLTTLGSVPGNNIVPDAVSSFMKRFYWSNEFKWLVGEECFYRHYDPKQFAVNIVCVDAVVVQAGHVLLVERARAPGQGLLALPGGHLEPGETLDQATARELLEETDISDSRGKMPPAVLLSYVTKVKVFDNPNRSLRGRVITQASFFQLPQRKEGLFRVRGMDDAAFATWYPIGSVDSTKMFEDHYSIIDTMLSM